MIRAMRRRLSGRSGEAGMTLIELLVAATMSVVITGAATAMLISAVKDQPALSKKSQNVTTARWQLERVVREIRNGVVVSEATPSRVSFEARVRRTACGGAASGQGQAAITCQVTYSCTTESCTRSEAVPGGAPIGSPTVALTGIDDPAVFCFVPSTDADPSRCGTASTPTPSYIGVTLRVPNPNGPGLLTISDGATLRTAALTAG